MLAAVRVRDGRALGTLGEEEELMRRRRNSVPRKVGEGREVTWVKTGFTNVNILFCSGFVTYVKSYMFDTVYDTHYCFDIVPTKVVESQQG